MFYSSNLSTRSRAQTTKYGRNVESPTDLSGRIRFLSFNIIYNKFILINIIIFIYFININNYINKNK